MKTLKVIKCVVMGDGSVGKTSLLITHISNEFPTDEFSRNRYTFPYSLDVTTNGTPILSLLLHDTVDNNESGELNQLTYLHTDVFLICFSLVNPASFEFVRYKWKELIHQHSPDTPIVLVGTKLDKRDDKDTVEKLMREQLSPISYSEGIAMAKKIGAIKYVECSALTNEGIREVFIELVRAALIYNNPPKVEHNFGCLFL